MKQSGINCPTFNYHLLPVYDICVCGDSMSCKVMYFTVLYLGA
jgi:hypothetical protein